METSLSIHRTIGLGSLEHRRLKERAPGFQEASRTASDDPVAHQPRLLDLLAARPDRLPFTVPIGLSNGAPLWISLEAPSAAHWLVADAPGPSRSDLVRSIALGLAMTTRPSLLQILSIDMNGRELHPLESLPHVAAETACDPLAARLSLRWLAAEFQARTADKRTWPRMLLVVDDLASLGMIAPRSLFEVLSIFLGCGAPAGIHVLAGVDRPALRNLTGGGRPVAVLEASGEPHRYTLAARGTRSLFTAVSVPVVDLDLALRKAAARNRPPGGGSAPAVRAAFGARA